MAANPAQLVPPVAQQPQPPVAQQPYPQQRRRTARPPTVQYSSAEVFGLLHIIEQISVKPKKRHGLRNAK